MHSITPRCTCSIKFSICKKHHGIEGSMYNGMARHRWLEIDQNLRNNPYYKDEVLPIVVRLSNEEWQHWLKYEKEAERHYKKNKPWEFTDVLPDIRFLGI